MQETIAGLVARFAALGDWDDRYRYIIELGQCLAPLPEELCTDRHRVRGCLSRVWLVSSHENGRMHYRAGGDAAIVNGLIALLLQVYDGRPPAEIIQTPPDFLHDIGLAQHLSPLRSNGLHFMAQRIRIDAQAALGCAGGESGVASSTSVTRTGESGT